MLIKVKVRCNHIDCPETTEVTARITSEGHLKVLVGIDFPEDWEYLEYPDSDATYCPNCKVE